MANDTAKGKCASRKGATASRNDAKRRKTPSLPPTSADITSEQLMLSPEEDGIAGIPAISHGSYKTNWQAMPEHVHKGCIELCYCSRGSLVFECEGKTYTLMPTSMFLTQPGDVHHLTTNHKGMRMYWLFFRYPQRGRSVLGLSVEETAELVERLKEIHAHDFSVDPSVGRVFRGIFKAYEELPRGAYRTLVLRTLILRILIETIHSAGNRPKIKELSKISEIAKLIARRPEHRFSIPEMAAHAKLSESYFTALFRQVIGLPPYAYLAKCRLDTACSRLEKSNDSIAEIAHDLGYFSPQHLANQFRKTFGMTPSEWREKRR